MRYAVVGTLTLIVSGFSFADSSSIEEVGETDQCLSQSDQARLLDKAFDYVNTKLCQPALWFDSFFVDERTDQDARAGTQFRWYNDFAYVEGKGYEFETKLKARLHLPGITQRLKLVFESDEESDVFDLLPSSQDEAESTFGLRYDWLSKDRTNFNIKVSARPSIEGRFKYTYPITNATVARFTQRIYQRKKVTGEITEFDIDHSFNEDFLLRWSSFARYEDDIKGWDLGTGLTLYQHISPTQALNYQVTTTGTNRPFRYIDDTQISVTYRQNFFRDWLYFELKPQYNWYKEEYDPRFEEAKFTLRLEVLFYNI